MTRRHEILLRLGTRHGYYGDAPVPLAWQALPETSVRLRGIGAVVRTVGAELVVGVGVAPSDPTDLASSLALTRPLAGVLRFALLPTSGDIGSVSHAPGWQPGRTVHALDNRRDDADAGAAVLGLGADRLGTPLALVTGPVLRIPLDAPLSGATVEIRDHTGTAIASTTAPPVPTDVLAVPLDRVPGPGRFTAVVTRGPTVGFVLAPSLRGRAPFAVAEIDLAATVAASSRVLDGMAPLGRRFVAAVSARSTRWRYVVVKTSGAAGRPVSEFAVEAPDGLAVTGVGGVFTTDNPVPWQRAPARTRLMRASDAVRPLPNPGPRTPLVEDASQAIAVHHVYV